MTENQEYNSLPILKGDYENLSLYGYSSVGGRTENQDCVAYRKLAKGIIFVVCDGMGGHAGGSTASTTAANTIIESFKKNSAIFPVKEAISTAVEDANLAVYTKAKEEPRLRGMGTTITLLYVDEEAAYITHVGDSRIYQFRNGVKRFRTFDHSMVFEQVAKGRLTEEDARTHPRSNILSQALGILPDIEVSVTKLDYRKGDRFVLCTDGVWNSLPEPEIIEMLALNDNIQETVKQTFISTEKIGRENGNTHDNHTMMIVDLKNKSQYSKGVLVRLFESFIRK